jgi:hypothetical protein
LFLGGQGGLVGAPRLAAFVVWVRKLGDGRCAGAFANPSNN